MAKISDRHQPTRLAGRIFKYPNFARRSVLTTKRGSPESKTPRRHALAWTGRGFEPCPFQFHFCRIFLVLERRLAMPSAWAFFPCCFGGSSSSARSGPTATNQLWMPHFGHVAHLDSPNLRPPKTPKFRWFGCVYTLLLRFEQCSCTSASRGGGPSIALPAYAHTAPTDSSRWLFEYDSHSVH